jgi:phage terminase Nu1 subunit (DNA packaging protein)
MMDLSRHAEIAALSGEGCSATDPATDPAKPIRRPALSAIEGSIPATLSAADLARFFDVDVRTIHMLRQKGVIESVTPRGTAFFDTRAAVAAYLRFGRRANTNDLESEKLRLATAQVEKIQLQNAAARGELIHADVVRHEWVSTAADLRAGLLALPSRVASRLGLDRATQAAIDSELREALDVLSKGEG